MTSSLRMRCSPLGLPRCSIRHVAPTPRRHQLRPAAVETPMVVLAHAEFAGPGAEVRIKAVMTEPHLRIERHPAGHHAAAGAGAFLPIVHVVLLEGARRAEAAHAGEPDRLLDMRRRRLVDEYP